MDPQRYAQEMETSISLKSPYGDNADLFNNEEFFPDMELVVAGMEKPLMLHKGIMAKGSQLVKGLLNAKQIAKSSDTNKVEWMFDASKEGDRIALVKVLRFCYGETMTVRITNGEYCAVTVALYRLKVTCASQVIATIAEFVVEQARRDAALGGELLKTTLCYPECCNQTAYELDKALAKVVFTASNVQDHFEAVVDGCLMKLPTKYLDLVEYGEPHTKYSEFAVRVLYVQTHVDTMSREEKEAILRKCDWTKLRSQEFKELRQLNVVEPDAISEARDRALENFEKERDTYFYEAARITQELEEYQERTSIAERECKSITFSS